jgi:hypothetical protein
MAGVKRKSLVRTLVVSALFLCLALAVTYPALRYISWWGVHDWVQFYTYYGVPHKAVMTFHELPGWNPYFYGGNVQWGHPDDPTLSPLFIPMLLFGVVAGVKIDLVLVLAGGMLSMWFLARRLELSLAAAFFASAVWGLNGWHAYHLAVGHCDHFTFLFEPLAVYFFLRACDDLRWGIGAAAVMAFMYLSGGPYPFVFTALLLAVLGLLLSGRFDSWRPVRAAVTVFIFAAGFAFIKLLPTIIFMLRSEHVPADATGTGLKVLWRGLFDSALPMYDEGRYVASRYGAWEYAAYIGYVAGIVFLMGAVLAARKAWPWLVMAAVFLVASFGSWSPVNFFYVFTAVPGLSGMHVPFRFVVHFIMAVAIVGGMGIDALRELISKTTARRAAAFIAVVLAAAPAADLIRMHYGRPVPLYGLASYLLPPKKYGGEMPAVPPYPRLTKGEEIYVPKTYEQALQVYIYFLESKRLSWGYDAARLPNAAKFPEDSGYRGEAYLLREAGGRADLVASTLSTYRVAYECGEANTVVLNENYMPGWRASGAAGGAYERGGLVAADVPAGKGEVEFAYRPASRLPAALVSLAAIGAAVLFARRLRIPGAPRVEKRADKDA